MIKRQTFQGTAIALTIALLSTIRAVPGAADESTAAKGVELVVAWSRGVPKIPLKKIAECDAIEADIQVATFCDDGTRVLVADANHIWYVIETKTGAVLEKFGEAKPGFAFPKLSRIWAISHEGRYVATIEYAVGKNILTLRDVDEHKTVVTIERPGVMMMPGKTKDGLSVYLTTTPLEPGGKRVMETLRLVDGSLTACKPNEVPISSWSICHLPGREESVVLDEAGVIQLWGPEGSIDVIGQDTAAALFDFSQVDWKDGRPHFRDSTPKFPMLYGLDASEDSLALFGITWLRLGPWTANDRHGPIEGDSLDMPEIRSGTWIVPSGEFARFTTDGRHLLTGKDLGLVARCVSSPLHFHPVGFQGLARPGAFLPSPFDVTRDGKVMVGCEYMKSFKQLVIAEIGDFGEHPALAFEAWARERLLAGDYQALDAALTAAQSRPDDLSVKFEFWQMGTSRSHEEAFFFRVFRSTAHYDFPASMRKEVAVAVDAWLAQSPFRARDKEVRYQVAWDRHACSCGREKFRAAAELVEAFEALDSKDPDIVKQFEMRARQPEFPPGEVDRLVAAFRMASAPTPPPAPPEPPEPPKPETPPAVAVRAREAIRTGLFSRNAESHEQNLARKLKTVRDAERSGGRMAAARACAEIVIAHLDVIEKSEEYEIWADSPEYEGWHSLMERRMYWEGQLGLLDYDLLSVGVAERVKTEPTNALAAQIAMRLGAEHSDRPLAKLGYQAWSKLPEKKWFKFVLPPSRFNPEAIGDWSGAKE